MRIPKDLHDDQAKDFWKRNAPILANDGRLTDQTRDAFMLMCRTWGTLHRCEQAGMDPIKLVALSKQIQQLMAAFGMTPASRKRLKLDEKKADLGAVLREALGD